jgi:hypothetical protein
MAHTHPGVPLLLSLLLPLPAELMAAAWEQCTVVLRI